MVTVKNIRAPNDKPPIGAAFQYPGESLKFFYLLTLEIYEMMVDLTISLNLLFNFPKQASTVVASNVLRKLFHFRLFATFNLLGHISEITTPTCDIDAITLVSEVFHDAIITTRVG